MGLTQIAPPICEEEQKPPVIDHVAEAHASLAKAVGAPHRWRGLLHVDFKKAKELAKQRGERSGGDGYPEFDPSDDRRVRTWLWPGSLTTVPNVVASVSVPITMPQFPTLSGESVHYPVLDIDMQDVDQRTHELLDRYFPRHAQHWVNSTHHWHLYVDWRMTWDVYHPILDVLAGEEVLERGYVSASKERGYTALRLPWIKKEDGE